MLVCVRTTINLPDALGDAARQRAREQGRTFTDLVEEGLRTVLAEPPAAPRKIELPSWGSGKDGFLVDILDKDALWDALDADGPR